jgi:hypothetical protein
LLENVLSVWDYGEGTVQLNLAENLDLSEDFVGTVGAEVYVDGTGWVPTDNVVWYTSDPRTIVFYFPLSISLVGKVWRLKPPCTTWTAGGLELMPQTGTISEPPAEGAVAKRPPDLRK